MANAKVLRLVPNATYIPLACVWVSQLLRHLTKIYHMLVYFALGNAKFWCWVPCPTPTPDVRYFTSQWNIGFSCIYVLYSVFILYCIT